MNKYKWSAKYNAFFPVSLLPSYEEHWEDLSDLVDVDDDVEIEFNREPPDGKVRVVIDGLPAWADTPALTQEELAAMAEQMKSSLRSTADSEISWRQDAVDTDMATEQEVAELAEWKKYRVLLMRVDTTNPVWPAPPTGHSS